MDYWTNVLSYAYVPMSGMNTFSNMSFKCILWDVKSGITNSEYLGIFDAFKNERVSTEI